MDNPAAETTARLCVLARRLVERDVRFVQIYCGAGSSRTRTPASREIMRKPVARWTNRSPA